MGSPPPTRWSTQRANDRYKDHLHSRWAITKTVDDLYIDQVHMGRVQLTHQMIFWKNTKEGGGGSLSIQKFILQIFGTLNRAFGSWNCRKFQGSGYVFFDNGIEINQNNSISLLMMNIAIIFITMTIYTGMRLRCCLKLGGTQSRNPLGRHSNLGRLEIKRFMLIISIWYELWTIITPFPLIQWCKHLIYVCIWKVFCKFIPANWLSIAYFYQFWAI